MSLMKEESGRRSVQVEVEVPGTPEEVWQAIATGPGVSAWFVPTECDEREGGAVKCNFGPGMDSVATITAWTPPHRFTAESQGMGPDGPVLATEWTVEARGGGTCVVRVVHSLFASTDDWDDQLTGIESGWPALFRILRLYLTHFRGQKCATFRASGFAPAPESEAWASITDLLGLDGAVLGAPCKTSAGAPPLEGAVEGLGEGKHPYQLLRLSEPAPGVAFLNSCGMGSQVYLAIGFYLYGDEAAHAVERNEPRWQAWMAEHFPAAGDATSGG